VRRQKKNRWPALILGLQLFLCSSLSWSQDGLLSLTVEGTSKATQAGEASRAIVASKMSDVAREQVIELIGEKSYNKNKSLIENRIIRQANKFIPFVQPGTPQKTEDGWKMTVELKVAIESLRQMILANGLYFDSEGPATVLPMIAIIDRVRAAQFRWWNQTPDESTRFLSQVSQEIHEALYRELNRNGFFVLRPHSSGLISIAPSGARGERVRNEDLRFIGNLYSAQLFVRGDIRFRESNQVSGGYQIAIKLSADQANNSRSIAEISRNFDVERGSFETVVRARLQTILPEVAKDLAVQVVDAWQRGTIGSNVLRLTLRGRLNPKQISDLKEQISKGVREVKSLRERVIETNAVTFEVDFSGGEQQLAERIKSLTLSGFNLKPSGSSESLTFDVRSL